MRVTIITATLSEQSGGLAVSVPSLVRGIERNSRMRVDIVGIEDPEAPDDAPTWGRAVHAHPLKGPRAMQFAPGMTKTMNRLRPRVVDAQGLWTYPSLVNLRHHRATGTPYVLTPRGMLDPWARARSPWKKKLVRWWFEDAHLRNAACLRATAEMEASHFRRFGLRQPIAVVPNGIGTPRYVRTLEGQGPCRLLFLSRVHPKKGLPFLLQAWAEVAPTRPDWELVIAGPDEVGHEAEMRALADKLALPRVRWWGAVSGQAKEDLYRSADLFVLPTHAENFGLVVGEALAHGVPAITTRNAPWEGLEANDCGWWINLSHDALVDALSDATNRETEDLLEMGKRGHAWMKRDFSWDRIAEQMAEVYRWVAYGGELPSCILAD